MVVFSQKGKTPKMDDFKYHNFDSNWEETPIYSFVHPKSQEMCGHISSQMGVISKYR